jgi:hypothetical protein
MIKLKSKQEESVGRIKILRCKDWMYWYNNEIGNTFTFYHETLDCFWVIAEGGYRNIVLKSDCEQIYPKDELRTSEVINEKEKTE